MSILNSLSSRSSRFESPIPFSRPTSRAGSSCGFVPSSPEPKLPLFRPSASPCFSNSPSNFSNSPCFSNSSPAYLPPSWARSAQGSSQESTTRVIRINQQSLLTSSTTQAPADNNNDNNYNNHPCYYNQYYNHYYYKYHPYFYNQYYNQRYLQDFFTTTPILGFVSNVISSESIVV